MYADDTQLYVPFKINEYESAITKLESCISEIRTWLAENHLKLNDEKTEFLVFGTKHMLSKMKKERSINIGESEIKCSESAKNIGAMLDSNLDMRSHVNHIARACYLHLRNIGHIRPNITTDAAASLIHAFISSKVDNLNCLLVGAPDVVIRKLQLIQNNAARLVMRKKRNDHVTPLLKELHWLPIRSRIKFKVCLLTFKALNGLAPKYIAELIIPYRPSRNLRSACTGLLRQKVPKLTNTGGRSFSVCAPKFWNRLPLSLRRCTELETFKKGLKTHLFKEAFENT